MDYVTISTITSIIALLSFSGMVGVMIDSRKMKKKLKKEEEKEMNTYQRITGTIDWYCKNSESNRLRGLHLVTDQARYIIDVSGSYYHQSEIGYAIGKCKTASIPLTPQLEKTKRGQVNAEYIYIES